MKTNLIILAAPSGAGKSSFIEKICKEYKVLFDTITFTTRSMRRGESQGVPYYFISKDEFESKIKENFFVEWAHVHNQLYGTSRVQIQEAWQQGRCVIMDVDIQGAKSFKELFPQARSVFILPPSIEELRRRIINRDGKIPVDIELRMQTAKEEMKVASEFDFRVINDDFEVSYADFKKIIENLLS